MDQYDLIMDIAMNVTRMGNWAADDFAGKKHRIVMFMMQTDDLIKQVKREELPVPLSQAITSFFNVYMNLRASFPDKVRDPLGWAEELMTWGNILTHRAQLLSSGKQSRV